MRGIAKPWPPKDISPLGCAPCSLREAEDEFLSALPVDITARRARARTQFDQLDKGKLREVMYREQRSICVYCESLIKEEHPVPTIEHWCALALYPDQALEWKNLYLSCCSPHSCNSAKGDQALRANSADPHLPPPASRAYEDIVGFTSRGEIYVRKDAVLDDATRSALERALGEKSNDQVTQRPILNLNHPSLVAARRAALDSEMERLERDFQNRLASKEKREEIAAKMLKRIAFPAFVSIRVAWLRKRLGKGRE
jgi:uncharacterized protein (TIGR02646 family)